ncbi:hypothetical protein [Saccharothrix variisporea]|uniref:Uncharacterized protein n=1 Tax=Saccharothrix variisporea TaxID=543527 RepID=A0A495XMC7_9PSEU|nr:hypothetical protein [Saccharothrix variisporea]RKT75062.1 hypothetical protein DFJ66_8439 [Saccharothrix variisporea]
MVKKKDVMIACERALRGLGFEKRSQILLRPVGSGSSGWVGLNTATQGLPRVMGVNPVIGVCFDHFDELSSALRDDVPRGRFPLISRPLGYLMPENTFRSWRFVEGVDVEQVAESLAAAVAEHGVPFIEKYAEWETLSRELEASGFLMEHERMKKLPMVLAMNGDVSRAWEMVEGELARVSGADTPYADSYRTFAERFRERFVRE